jgi:hypothetical protein
MGEYLWIILLSIITTLIGLIIGHIGLILINIIVTVIGITLSLIGLSTLIIIIIYSILIDITIFKRRIKWLI